MSWLFCHTSFQQLQELLIQLKCLLLTENIKYKKLKFKKLAIIIINSFPLFNLNLLKHKINIILLNYFKN